MIVGKRDKLNGTRTIQRKKSVDSLRDALLAGAVKEGISKEFTFKQRSEMRNQAMENLREECTRFRSTVSLKDCYSDQLSRFEV